MVKFTKIMYVKLCTQSERAISHANYGREITVSTQNFFPCELAKSEGETEYSKFIGARIILDKFSPNPVLGIMFLFHCSFYF